MILLIAGTFLASIAGFLITYNLQSCLQLEPRLLNYLGYLYWDIHLNYL